MKFTIFQNSRQGQRAYNQDRLAYSYSKDSLLLVLADGMGGHRHGEVAAELAIKTITDSFQRLAKLLQPLFNVVIYIVPMLATLVYITLEAAIYYSAQRITRLYNLCITKG